MGREMQSRIAESGQIAEQAAPGVSDAPRAYVIIGTTGEYSDRSEWPVRSVVLASASLIARLNKQWQRCINLDGSPQAVFNRQPVSWEESASRPLSASFPRERHSLLKLWSHPTAATSAWASARPSVRSLMSPSSRFRAE